MRQPPGAILRNEPLRRGGAKPHMCEELCRSGGEQVYVSSLYPNGVTVDQYRRLVKNPKLAMVRWTAMRRNPLVFVRGRVRHPDHRTIVLRSWHRVVLNTESEAPGTSYVAFLD